MDVGETRRRQYLDAMGIQVWLAARPAQATSPAPPAATTYIAEVAEVADAQEVGDDIAGLTWEALRGRVLRCTRCGLHKTRTQGVFGVGDPAAQWLIVGEAPGAEEDRQGEPFVGPAGKLLNNMLLAVGLRREQVYITNIVKSRPPNNRDPLPEEARACEPYLQRQIALIRPKLVLAVGRVAAQSLLKTERPVGALRGRKWHYPDTDIPVVVTYHPAYLLRSPQEKRKAWDDLQLARRVFSEVGP